MALSHLRPRFARNHAHQNPSPLPSGRYFYTTLYTTRNRSLPLNDQITRVSVRDRDHPRTTLPDFSFLGDHSGSETTVDHSSNGLTFSDSNASQLDVYSSESGSWKSPPILAPKVHEHSFVHGAVWNGELILMSCGRDLEFDCAKHDHLYIRFDINAEKLTTARVPYLDKANENDLAVVVYDRDKVIQYNIECKTWKVLCDLSGGDFFARVCPLYEGVQSVKENNVQHCAADFQCQCSPSARECPLTLEPEAFKLLKNNLGPVIRQQLMELREKTRTVESAIEMADPTINMLKLLRESNSEFNAVRENMLNGAQQLRDASDKLGNEMHNVY
ncbi:hypothetical protein RHSIM_Rhsim10G0184500 [Rhododendron simsii]|uniref:Uncharacterized protein n=1 Tax=Rhododendron simsii TaxID=118357 RepID=A0A834G9Y4_RHOSS|nr:hypothetical protein RHSIM_Rhsim10G0184500 [Rhododendron simsii]